MKRVYLLSAIGIIVLVALAMLSINLERYYPLVRIVLPDQSTLLFIDVPWTDSRKCHDANLKIVETVRQNCPQCKFDSSCEKQLDAAWQTALAGQPINSYVVHSGTQRVVVNAAGASKQTCEAMAELVVRNKKKAARCVPPVGG